jgi:protein-tyrosine-phosphatase
MNTDFLKAYEDLSNLQEANNKVTGRFDRPIARGGSWFGINPAYSEDELARIEHEKAEAKAATEEKEKQQLLNKYLDKISTITTADEAHQFNRRHYQEASRKEYLPLIDVDTLEPIYDQEEKDLAYSKMRDWVRSNWKAGEEERAQRDAVNYTWHCRTKIGERTPILATQYFPKDANPEDCILTMKQLGKEALNKMAREARAFGETFKGTGELIITYLPDPAHREKEETVKVIQLTKKTKA